MNREVIEGRLGHIVGRWQLVRVLGAGGMASVYRGEDGEGGTAAVKVLHPDHTTNPHVVGRFKREAFIMGLSKHPRAVEVYEEGFTEINEPYYAMELLSQESLNDRWKTIELFDPLRAIGYMTSLLEVLETYHAHGVIHRDIKPANLIMDGDFVRLVDFGVSRYRDEQMAPEDYTKQGSTIGTPAYMAPEQAMGQVDKMDHRTDLFAVGAVLYALVGGQKLHRGRTTEETLLKAASQPAESIARYAPELPGILIGFIDKSLSWFQNDRYQSAGEMLDELMVVQALCEREVGSQHHSSQVVPTGERAPDVSEDIFYGSAIMPSDFEIPTSHELTPPEPKFPTAMLEPDSEAFQSAMLEPDSEAFHSAMLEPDSEPVSEELYLDSVDEEPDEGDIFDSAIFKPSADFTAMLEQGRTPEASRSPAPEPAESETDSQTSGASSAGSGAPKFAVGQGAGPAAQPDKPAPVTRSSTPAPREQPRRPRPSTLRARHSTAKKESDVERAAVIAFGDGNAPAEDPENKVEIEAELLYPMFQAIERVFAGARMYDWEHPDVIRRLSLATDEVLEVLALYPDSCAFQIRRLNFAVDDEPVWHPGEPLDKIPFNLFAAGFRHIRFKPNLTQEDMARFLKLAMLNPKTDLAIEDDLATAFWDLDLKSIDAQMVTSFRVSDDENEQARFERAVEELETEINHFFAGPGAEQLQLLMALAELGEGALAEAHYSRPELLLARRLNRGTFASEYKEQFVEALDRDLWLQRAVFVLVAALLDVVREGDPERLSDPLRELVPRFLLEGEINELMELIDKVAQAVPEGETRDLVFAWVFDKRNVDRFVRYLRNDEDRLMPETHGRAKTYLPKGSPEAVEQVLATYVELPASKRDIVTAYLAENCAGNQELFGETIVGAPTGAAVELVKVLTAVTDLATARALQRILEHEDPAVREQALTEMAEHYPAEVEDILLEMVQDENASIRVQALKLASSADSVSVTLHLVETAKSGDFHELPFTERRLVLETLFDLDRQKGEETAIEIVKRKLNLRLDPAAHTTRSIACQLLGEFGVTEDGYMALEDTMKRRIGNPEKVREAARQALARWMERT